MSDKKVDFNTLYFCTCGNFLDKDYNCPSENCKYQKFREKFKKNISFSKSGFIKPLITLTKPNNHELVRNQVYFALFSRHQCELANEYKRVATKLLKEPDIRVLINFSRDYVELKETKELQQILVY